MSSFFLDSLYKDKPTWYSLTKDFWNKSEASAEGMLEGNMNVNEIDINVSCSLIDEYLKKSFIKPGPILEIGAGVGRVTKSVLIKYFDEITILEQNEKFLKKAKEDMKEYEEKKKLRYINQAMQDLIKDSSVLNNEKYSLIWIQWCVENIDDEDLVGLLTKLKGHLIEKGVVVVKENIIKENEEVQINDIDYSRVRTDSLFKDLFKKSGYRIFKSMLHPNWPKDMMGVGIYFLMK